MIKILNRVTVLVGFVSFCSVFLLYGYQKRNALLANNLCAMTFMKYGKQPLSVHSNSNSTQSSSYKLWKITNPKNSKSLNRQPVLFVPGHLGSVDQVRSLNSHMHNDNNHFQYFALDFNEEPTAFHGSNVFAQAVFLNEALEKIRDMYSSTKYSLSSTGGDDDDEAAERDTTSSSTNRNSNNTNIANNNNNNNATKLKRKIMIVGHSMGGLVARTAVLLSNHPANCIVGDIVMLSTPNVAAPYTADASLETLYSAVNKAWMQAFYDQHGKCRAAHKAKHQQAADGLRSTAWSGIMPSDTRTTTTTTNSSTTTATDANSSNYRSDQNYLLQHQGITADYSCPRCVTSVRLTSITGGDIDLHVPPHLSPVFDITPRPRNITAERILQGRALEGSRALGRGGVASAAIDMMYRFATWPFRYALSLVSSFASPTEVGSNSSSNSSNNNSSSIYDSSQSSCVEGSSTETCSSSSSSSSSDGLDSISPLSWERHVLAYRHAAHLSLRSSQLRDVGFSVDHHAVCWCWQLAHAVSTGMTELSNSPVNTLHTEEEISDVFAKAFPLREEFAVSYKDFVVSAPQLPSSLHHFLANNKSRSLFYGEAALRDFASLESNTSTSSSTTKASSSSSSFSSAAGGVGTTTAKKNTLTSTISSILDKLLPPLPIQLQVLALSFLHTQLHKVVLCYFVLCCLSIAVFPFRALCNHRDSKSLGGHSNWWLLSPWTHCNMDLIAPAAKHFASLLAAGGSDSSNGEGGGMMMSAGMKRIVLIVFHGGGVGVLGWSALSFYYAVMAGDATAQSRVAWEASRSCFVMYWLIAYGLAILLKAAMLSSLLLLQTVLKPLVWLVSTMGQYTVWNSNVRRVARKTSKLLKTGLKKVLPASLCSVLFSLFGGPLALWSPLLMYIAACYWSSGRRTLGEAHFALSGRSQAFSTATVVLYFFSVVMVVCAICCPPYTSSSSSFSLLKSSNKNSRSRGDENGSGEDTTNTTSTSEDTKHLSEMSAYYTELLLLYIPAVLVAGPSFFFACRVLFFPVDQFHEALPLFSLFGPERIHYLMAVAVIAAHLYSARALDNTYYINAQPITWLEELFGPHVVFAQRRAANGFGFISADIMNGSKTGNKTCIHEDGGEGAVFEPVAPHLDSTFSEVEYKEVGKDLVLGTTYRVVYCDCAHNKKLKEVADWCEWCRCRKCGGKHLPPPGSGGGRAGRGAYDPDSLRGGSKPIQDFSADLLLLCAMYIVPAMLLRYVGSQMYLYLYYAGLVAGAYALVSLGRAFHFI